MVGLTYFGPFLLLIPFASAGMTTALLRAASHSHASEELTLKQTLQLLDANLDGHIDPSEVEAFAHDEGLDEDSAIDDFSSLDTNGDGKLDSAELLQVLGKNATATRATPVPKASLAVAQQATSVQKQPVPVTIKSAAVKKPDTTGNAKQSPRISIQEPQPAQILEALRKQPLTPPSPKMQQPPQAVPPPPPPPATQTPLITEVVKPAPVERMAKHFAQVLRTAEINMLPASEEKEKLAKSTIPSKTVDDIVLTKAKNTRATVQSAAKEVAEQLTIAETAEAQARVADRRAAEERANATVLAKLTTQEALNAGAAAAHAKAKELLAKIAKLEDSAERAQVRAAAMHSKAKLESEEASELMSVADRALNHYSFDSF